jgi:2-phospho-L-lactate guanylyltransferase
MNRQSDWCVIIPVSDAGRAKTRLRPLGELRGRLAQSLARDVVAAVRGTRAVSRVLIVGDGSLLPEVTTDVVDPGPAQLNPAIVAAESQARALGYDRIAVIVADIACARSADVDAMLTRARGLPRGFVADHLGVGTTVLTTTGPGLAPSFGTGSAARHQASGAVPLDVSVRVRFDIDDPSDVTVATAYGVGRATAAVLAAAGLVTVSRG